MQKEMTGIVPDGEEPATTRLLISSENVAEDKNGSDLESAEINSEELKEPKKATQDSAANQKLLKNTALALLAIQNCALILCMKYSKSNVAPGGKPYLSTTVVVVGEFSKLMICFAYITYTKGGIKGFIHEIDSEMIKKPGECLKLLIPSLLYTLQNNLQFMALSHISAAVFQVTAQLKILTTAVFSVLILGRVLGWEKWGGLMVLTVGCILVNLDSIGVKDKSAGGGAEGEAHSTASQMVGLGYTLMGTVTSGLAGVYLEKMLKSSQTTLWVRNVQLGIGGLCIGSLGAWVNDGDKIMEDGFFQGYDHFTWIVIVLSSAGGILVAVVVKYADNLYKAFAVSISIVLSSIVSIPLFGFTISVLFVIGALLVLSSIFLYEKIVLFDRPLDNDLHASLTVQAVKDLITSRTMIVLFCIGAIASFQIKI